LGRAEPPAAEAKDNDDDDDDDDDDHQDDDDNNKDDEHKEDELKSKHTVQELVRHCPGCLVPTVHYRGDGCHHMTCSRCTEEWCWGCERIFKTCNEEDPCGINVTCDKYCTICPEHPLDDEEVVEERPDGDDDE
jgi:hypothetical protein